MAQYQVPPELLAAPHYVDAMSWVFLHMTTIGLIIGAVGWAAKDYQIQRTFSRLLFVVTCVYTALDMHTADWPLGNHMYKGPQSLAPVFVDLLAIVLWGRLNLIKPVANLAAAPEKLG